MLVSLKPEDSSRVEKEFQVDLRKTLVGKSPVAAKQSEVSSLKQITQQLSYSREIFLPTSKYQKTRQVQVLKPRPLVYAPKRPIEKSLSTPQPIPDTTPVKQEFVIKAQSFPTPVPTKRPTPKPTLVAVKKLMPKPTPVSTGKPTLKPTPVTPKKSITEPIPVATTTPMFSPAPIVRTPLLVEADNPSRSEYPSPERIVPLETRQSQHTNIIETTNVSELPGMKQQSEEQETILLKKYLQKIAMNINKVKKYPRQARKKGWEGTIVVKLHIFSTGDIEKIALVEKSRYNTLNKAALKAIEKAQPFPEFYPGLSLEFIDVNIPIHFTLGKR